MERRDQLRYLRASLQNRSVWGPFMAADNSDLPEMAAKEREEKRVTHLQQATAGKEQHQQQLAGGVVGCRCCCFDSRHVHCRSSKRKDSFSHVG